MGSSPASFRAPGGARMAQDGRGAPFTHSEARVRCHLSLASGAGELSSLFPLTFSGPFFVRTVAEAACSHPSSYKTAARMAPKMREAPV